ncbi:MAG: response regulator [Chloroflexales bacterium]|nr:response regulator [Chloroflexales bacterium]
MLRPATVLIVDDLASSREVLYEILLGEGYELLMAEGGAQALTMAREYTPDLVLLDMMMPDVDGLTVCRELRADPRTAKVPVIFVTALEDRSARLSGIAAGCDDFVSKPFDRIELRLRVRTVVGLNRYRLLHDEQLRFERLFTLSPNGLLIVDGQGMVRLANPAIASLVGLASPNDLAGHSLPAMLTLEDQARCVEWLVAAVEQRQSATHLGAYLTRRDGARLPVILDAGWFEWAGEPALQVIVRDMTDRRRAELLEEDRRRLVFDLHDDIAQTATAVYRQLEQLGRHYHPRRPTARASLERAHDLTRRLMRDTRRLLAGLRPAALDDLGLAAALRQHAADLRADGLRVDLHETIGTERPPAPIETALFRIAQEALNNVRKHAGTGHAVVQLTREGLCLRLTIEDNGPGLPSDPEPGPAGAHLGLRAMHERAALLGGTLIITSAPGVGTRIVAEVPLPHTDEQVI